MAVAYIIRERAVASFNAPGQPVNRLMHDAMKDAARLSRGYIKSRSGELARSTRVKAPPMIRTRYKLSGVVHATADHALYVHEGTTGPIRSDKGRMLSVPSLRKSAGGRVLKESVAGQSANPFLRKGISAAMRGNSKLFYGRRF